MSTLRRVGWRIRGGDDKGSFILTRRLDEDQQRPGWKFNKNHDLAGEEGKLDPWNLLSCCREVQLDRNARHGVEVCSVDHRVAG